MKAKILILILILFGKEVFAQDSTSISYSEVQDTLVKQRFIDRYENVFMTKVPTRHMFKVGISHYKSIDFGPPILNEIPFPNKSLQIGYEFKILPSFSFALTGNIPGFDTYSTANSLWRNSEIDTELRWYINMRKRIKTGKSANNFSGNYIAFSYHLPENLEDPLAKYYTPTGNIYRVEKSEFALIGLKFGLQRRFFNSGYLDFAMSYQQIHRLFYYGLFYKWRLSSQFSLGFAFGDWKKKRDIEICQVFLCEENISKQWKIQLPEFTFGYYTNRIKVGTAYEQRVRNYPLTINYQIDGTIGKGYHNLTYNEVYNTKLKDRNLRTIRSLSRELLLSFSIQPRYYFLQNRQKQRGKSANGISSFYTGLNIEDQFYLSRHGFSAQSIDIEILKIKQNTLLVGPLLGFQQRVFKSGYIDLNTSYNYKHEVFEGDDSFGFRGNMGIGLAF